MFSSRILAMNALQLPMFIEAQLYMHEFDLANPTLPEGYEHFRPVFEEMVKRSPIKEGKAYITIDSREVQQGTTHRRPGPHVDGNYLYAWQGGSGWLTGSAGRILPMDKHMKQYNSPKGGTLIASSYSACKAWVDDFESIPKQGGDCSHLRLDDTKSLILESNRVYLMNSTCVHESLPVNETVKRTLLRITLPDTETVL